MSPISDRELIKRSIDGDSQAFSILIKRVETPLVKLVKSKTPDPASAEDVLQEVLLDVWQGLKGLRDPDRWTVWVMQIARNRCHDFFRLAQRREAPMANSDLEPIPNASKSCRNRLIYISRMFNNQTNCSAVGKAGRNDQAMAFPHS